MNLAELTEGLSRLQEIFGSRFEHLFFQINWYAEHPHQRFDVTFYEREPLLEVTLADDFVRKWHTGLHKSSINKIAFSDGTIVDAAEIWVINYMPHDLDNTNVDLAEGAQVGGINGETIREIIRHTYRCQSRAEEDHFLARWIAS